jgi:hypothetical protein
VTKTVSGGQGGSPLTHRGRSVKASAPSLVVDSVDVGSAAPLNTRTFAVQIRYARSEWVTLERLTDHRAAVRRAAAAYRDAVSPDGALPSQVRLLELPAR